MQELQSNEIIPGDSESLSSSTENIEAAEILETPASVMPDTLTGENTRKEDLKNNIAEQGADLIDNLQQLPAMQDSSCRDLMNELSEKWQAFSHTIKDEILSELAKSSLEFKTRQKSFEMMLRNQIQALYNDILDKNGEFQFIRNRDFYFSLLKFNDLLSSYTINNENNPSFSILNQRLKEILTVHGFSPMKVQIGDKFDAEKHHCFSLEISHNSDTNDTVSSIIEDGNYYRNFLIRPALVKVWKYSPPMIPPKVSDPDADIIEDDKTVDGSRTKLENGNFSENTSIEKNR